MYDDGPVVVIIPGALRRRNAAAYCDIPLRTWDVMRAAGDLPRPCVDNGTSGLWWLTKHLDLWNEQGRPNEMEFDLLLEQQARGKRRRVG